MTAVPSPPRRAAVAFILVTVLLDVMAMGIVIPVLPRLVETMAGGDTAQAARIFGVFGFAWALMQFVVSPVQGALSDHFGRRPLILLSNLGLGLDHMLCALAPNLIWLFIGRVISGICAASFSTANAYIADVTPPEERAAKFGLIGAAFGVGFVLGPAIGGLLGAADPRLPFWVAAGLSLANAAYGYFVLPESLAADKREPFSWSKASPLGALRLLRQHRQLLGLAAIMFLDFLAHAVLPAVSVLYAGYRYGWTERDIGLLLAFVGVCSAVVQAGLIKPAIARFGERPTLLAGLLFGALGFAVYGLAPTGLVFMAAVPIQALWGLANSPLQSIMTRHVSASEQGQLQGANSSLMGLASMIGPILFTQVFAWAIAGSPKGMSGGLAGLPFLLAAALVFAAAGVAWWVARGERDDRVG